MPVIRVNDEQRQNEMTQQDKMQMHSTRQLHLPWEFDEDRPAAHRAVGLSLVREGLRVDAVAAADEHPVVVQSDAAVRECEEMWAECGVGLKNREWTITPKPTEANSIRAEPVTNGGVPSGQNLDCLVDALGGTAGGSGATNSR